MSQLRPLTQIKNELLFGTEKFLLRIRTNSKRQPYEMPDKHLCHPITSCKIIQGGRVGGWEEKRISTMQNL